MLLTWSTKDLWAEMLSPKAVACNRIHVKYGNNLVLTPKLQSQTATVPGSSPHTGWTTGESFLSLLLKLSSLLDTGHISTCFTTSEKAAANDSKSFPVPIFINWILTRFINWTLSRFINSLTATGRDSCLSVPSVHSSNCALYLRMLLQSSEINLGSSSRTSGNRWGQKKPCCGRIYSFLDTQNVGWSWLHSFNHHCGLHRLREEHPLCTQTNSCSLQHYCSPFSTFLNKSEARTPTLPVVLFTALQLHCPTTVPTMHCRKYTLKEVFIPLKKPLWADWLSTRLLQYGTGHLRVSLWIVMLRGSPM